MPQDAAPKTIVQRTDALATRIALAGVAVVLLLAFSSGLDWPGRYAADTLSFLTFLATIAAAVTISWRIRKRTRTVLKETRARACRFCLYDLRASPPAGPCPECGEIYDLKRTIAHWREAYPDLPFTSTDRQPLTGSGSFERFR